MSPVFPITLALYAASCALYLALVAVGVQRATVAPQIGRAARLLLVAAFLSHAIEIGLMCVHGEHPASSAREALSFIGWPLEFGHTFVYFGATLLEAVALTQVGDPQGWFALNALYAVAVWGLYGYDLRIVRRHADDFGTADERALLDDIVSDQRINIRFMMPAAIAFQGLAWWLVRTYPAIFIDRGWHLLLIGLTLLFSVNYLLGGVRLLQRRQAWIVSRNAQERLES